MINFSKIKGLTALLIIFIVIAGLFTYQWWQVKGELGKKIGENEGLTKQINELKKEVEKLKAVEEKTLGEVTITTDKTEYEQGEEISYVVKNNKNSSIWFPQAFYLDTSLFDIEKKEGDEWIVLGYSRKCPPPGYREAPPLIEIKSGEFQKLSWDQTFCNIITDKTEKASEGLYRIKFRYYLKPALGLENYREVHSNEFIIK